MGTNRHRDFLMLIMIVGVITVILIAGNKYYKYRNYKSLIISIPPVETNVSLGLDRTTKIDTNKETQCVYLPSFEFEIPCNSVYSTVSLITKSNGEVIHYLLKDTFGEVLMDIYPISRANTDDSECNIMDYDTHVRVVSEQAMSMKDYLFLPSDEVALRHQLMALKNIIVPRIDLRSVRSFTTGSVKGIVWEGRLTVVEVWNVEEDEYLSVRIPNKYPEIIALFLNTVTPIAKTIRNAK